jgi:hypothetical protein
VIPPRTLQAILEEVDRLGATGGEPSPLGELLAEAVVDTSEQHADTADLLALIDRLGDSRNPYVRQRLAFSIAEHVKWQVNRHQGVRLALALWRKQLQPDVFATQGMLLNASMKGLYAGVTPSGEELAFLEEKLLAALSSESPSLQDSGVGLLWALRKRGLLAGLPPKAHGRLAEALETFLPQWEMPGRTGRKALASYEVERLEQVRLLAQELKQFP